MILPIQTAKNQQEIAFNDLWDFVINFNLEKMGINNTLKNQLKILHRNAYPLLLWRQEIEAVPLWPKSIKKTLAYNAYLSETISDLSVSLFLYSQGIYKTAHLILRSAIENFIKSLGIANNKKVLNLKSTFDVFQKVKKCEPMKSTDEAMLGFNRLKVNYAELCKSVHSVDEQYMDALSKLRMLPQYDINKSKTYSQLYEDTCKSMVIILTFFMTNKLHAMHYSHKDIILKAIPPVIRKKIMQS